MRIPIKAAHKRKMGIITDDKGVVRAIGQSESNTRRFMAYYWTEFGKIIGWRR